ncbi:MAG TPA: rod shape-determining protein, partial [Armatimonadota bacterium]|nr:rod shape-determining protein [Armatimonadota bacterium]
YPTHEETSINIRGKDLVTGLPKGITLTSDAVREYIREAAYAIVDLVKETLDATPPELAADIMNRGIVLAGGGALLRGLDQLIAAETGIPVYVAEDPMTCVVMGAAKYLEELGNQPDEI